MAKLGGELYYAYAYGLVYWQKLASQLSTGKGGSPQVSARLGCLESRLHSDIYMYQLPVAYFCWTIDLGYML